ncbi:hypothetical protein HYS84_00115 [Candidatus Saccharibacteria bacterium]|nr:hypothetical protein [Candidatus Saccharibacteria bacterium]
MPNETSVEEQNIHDFLPVEMADYIKALETKHFGNGESSIGSRFLDVGSLEDLLTLAISQRGGLSGDDRTKLIEMGVPETALLSQCRYLTVETPGEVGITKVSELPPPTPIEVVRTKPNTPCSLVYRSTDFPKTNLGLIIIGPNQKQKPEAPEPSTKEVVWTVHPGPPIRPASEDIWPENSTITAQEVVTKLGSEVYVNVAQPRHS